MRLYFGGTLSLLSVFWCCRCGRYRYRVSSIPSPAMFLFPGHRYLGPGNPLDNGEPVDEDDRIAQDHDQAYSRAESDSDIFAADRSSFGAFTSDFLHTGNWHSALGAAGLGVKNLVEEKILGRTLYGMPGGRKRGNQGELDSTAAKRLHGEGGAEAGMSGSDELSDMPSAPGGAGVGGHHTHSSEVVQQILRVPRDHGVVTVFRDSKILTTWGYAMSKIDLKYDAEKTFSGIVTSLSRLPVDRPYLYIPHGTFLALPPHTRALECSVKITPHGLRTPWKTGSSVVQPVNSDMLVYGVSSVGLNHHFDTGMCRITQGVAQNAMKPQTVQPFSATDHTDLSKSYWGLHVDADSNVQRHDDRTSIPTCMGAPRHNFAYDFIHFEHMSPRMTKHVNQYPFKGQVGTPIVNYHHKFKNAWLRLGPTYESGNELLTRTSLGLSVDVAGYTTSNLSHVPENKQTPVTHTTSRLHPDDILQRKVNYMQPLEKSWFTRGLAPMHLDEIQPSVGFGIMAVSKSNKDDPGSTDRFQDVAAFFQVDTELVVHTDVDTIAPSKIMLSSKAGPYLRHTKREIKLSTNSLSRHGRPVHLNNTAAEIVAYDAAIEAAKTPAQ